jgi:hypothetical protein
VYDEMNRGKEGQQRSETSVGGGFYRGDGEIGPEVIDRPGDPEIAKMVLDVVKTVVVIYKV